MAKKIIIREDQLKILREGNGDITLQAMAQDSNSASYQLAFNDPQNQEQIKQADAVGGDVNVRISGNKGGSANGMEVSVSGKDGLNNMNDATKSAIANGADLLVHDANKVNETRKLLSKKQIEAVRLKNLTENSKKFSKKELNKKILNR